MFSYVDNYLVKEGIVCGSVELDRIVPERYRQVNFGCTQLFTSFVSNTYRNDFHGSSDFVSGHVCDRYVCNMYIHYVGDNMIGGKASSSTTADASFLPSMCLGLGEIKDSFLLYDVRGKLASVKMEGPDLQVGSVQSISYTQLNKSTLCCKHEFMHSFIVTFCKNGTIHAYNSFPQPNVTIIDCSTNSVVDTFFGEISYLENNSCALVWNMDKDESQLYDLTEAGATRPLSTKSISYSITRIGSQLFPLNDKGAVVVGRKTTKPIVDDLRTVVKMFALDGKRHVCHRSQYRDKQVQYYIDSGFY